MDTRAGILFEVHAIFDSLLRELKNFAEGFCVVAFRCQVKGSWYKSP